MSVCQTFLLPKAQRSHTSSCALSAVNLQSAQYQISFPFLSLSLFFFLIPYMHINASMELFTIMLFSHILPLLYLHLNLQLQWFVSIVLSVQLDHSFIKPPPPACLSSPKPLFTPTWPHEGPHLTSGLPGYWLRRLTHKRQNTSCRCLYQVPSGSGYQAVERQWRRRRGQRMMAGQNVFPSEINQGGHENRQKNIHINDYNVKHTHKQCLGDLNVFCLWSEVWKLAKGLRKDYFKDYVVVITLTYLSMFCFYVTPPLGYQPVQNQLDEQLQMYLHVLA